MAKTALTQLQDQIEAIRREAYDAGYAAAMQAIRDFVAHPSAAAAPPSRTRAPAKPPRAAKPVPAAKTPQRRRRGAAKAATASRPRTRYTIGRDAAILARLSRVLPDRVLDRVVRRVLRPHLQAVG